jgi:hypothetical protein
MIERTKTGQKMLQSPEAALRRAQATRLLLFVIE